MRTILAFIFIALSAAGSMGQVQVGPIKEPDISAPPVRFVTATADLPQCLQNVISTDPVLPEVRTTCFVTTRQKLKLSQGALQAS